MKKYIQSSKGRSDNRPIRKICVSGKGGVGKSTLTSLIARNFSDKGFRVLVLDTDESNPSLYRKLGLDHEPTPLLSYLDRFSMQYGIPEGTWLSKDEIKLDDIPEEFLVTNNSISLMETGKINDPFQGCACSMADLSRQLMKNLALNNKELVIVDLEAGVESFGRGIEQGVDTIIIVAEPSIDSLELAGKILSMANGIGIRRVYTIVNKVMSEEVAEDIKQAANDISINILATLTIQKDVTQASIKGTPISNASQVYTAVGKMIDLVLKEDINENQTSEGIQ